VNGEEGAEPVAHQLRRGGSLTVLGCDGSYPGPGGAASGYLVRAAGVTLWMDAGPGTFAALQRAADPASVDAVVLSHEHPDHWSDVDSFAVWLRDAAPCPPVPVYAPPGLRPRSYFADDPVLGWHEVEPDECVLVRPRSASSAAGVTVGAGGVTGNVGDAGTVRPAAGAAPGMLSLAFCATDHGPPTFAVRIEPRIGGDAAVVGSGGRGAALGYTADTGPGWSPAELGPGIDLLLCEATFTRDREGEGKHLSGRQAGRLAAGAGVARLLLTHRRPSTDPDALLREAVEAFGRPAEQAASGLVYRW
jgi:ribonuclease BN (tRNA processing enzyme)